MERDPGVVAAGAFHVIKMLPCALRRPANCDLRRWRAFLQQVCCAADYVGGLFPGTVCMSEVETRWEAVLGGKAIPWQKGEMCRRGRVCGTTGQHGFMFHSGNVAHMTDVQALSTTKRLDTVEMTVRCM